MLDAKPMADSDVEAFLREVGSVAPATPAPEDAMAAALTALGAAMKDVLAPVPPMPADMAADLDDYLNNPGRPDPAFPAGRPPEALAERMTAAELLDDLAEAEAKAVAIRLQMEAALDSVLTSAQREAMGRIRAEFGPRITAAQADATQVREAVVELVKAAGKSVKGARLHAVYAAGRVTWDTKRLDGYAIDHPELLVLRNQGEPTVSIRQVR